MTNGHDVDEFLDDLRNAVNVQPSPGFEARVRVRVATEVPGRRWWWLGAAAAVAAAAVLVVMPMLKSGGVGRLKPFQAVQVDRAPAATEIVAPTEHASAAPVRSVVHAAARRRTQRVIVPSEEEAALQRLVAAMWSGQVQAPPYLTSNEAPLEIDTLPTPEPIQLSTIRIDPIYEEF